jgi:RNA polymerase sigma factor (sigma-70 family)
VTWDLMTVVTVSRWQPLRLSDRILQLKGLRETDLREAERVVRSLAYEFVNGMEAATGRDQDAMVGEALASIVDSVFTFDPYAGAKFSSWAHTRARYTLLDELRRQDPAGRTRRDRIRRGELEEEEWDKAPLSLEELRVAGVAAETGLGSGEVDWTDILPEAGEEPTEEILAGIASADYARWLFQVLEARQAEVLFRRFWLGETRDQIVEAMALSPTIVYNAEREAKATLRGLLEEGVGPE